MPSPLRFPIGLVLMTVLAFAGEAQADLTGHWHAEITGWDPFADIVETGGGAVSITLYASGSPTVFNGTVIGNTVSATAPGLSPCPGNLALTLFADDATMDGLFRVDPPCGPSGTRYRAFMGRCECFDTNAADGDGCDAACQVEPCFTCTGEPSVCTPSLDGAVCDDHDDCTVGETCASGVCGSGGTSTPCVDLTGSWHIHDDYSGFGTADYTRYVDQRNGTVVFRSAPGGALSWAGAIDRTTGAMSLAIPSTLFFCTSPAPFTGTAALDGLTFSGTAVAQADMPGHCGGFTFPEVGSRCGGGTIDAGETCDDGNRTDGDGCSSTCAIEICFVCAGSPSVCTAEPPAAACDDGDLCTFGDACTVDHQCVATPYTCGACETCDGSGACVVAPRPDCHASLVPKKSQLQLTDKTADAKDKIKWQWRAGSAVAPADLGDPLATNAVATCLYDTSGPTPSLLFRAVVPPGGSCGTKPCWKAPNSGGFQYKNKLGAEGIVGLTLRPGADLKSRVDVKGAGTGLDGRPLGLPAPPLPVPLRMQVQVVGAGCFDVDHGAAGVKANKPGSFKARGTP